MTAEDWTEKYRPQSLKDIVGNPTSAESMRQWALSWQKGIPKYRAMVLIGTPGIGKTSAAEALARDMGWGIVEMNASDQRTGPAIENVAGRAAIFNSFGDDGNFKSTKEGGMKLIVLDEADSLYGNADRGAMPAIMELVRHSKQPVILICNDFYGLSKKSSAIKTETFQITFRKPQTASIEKVLMKICAKEHAHVEADAIHIIAENADGDLRAAVRDLQSLVLGYGDVTADMAKALGQRESRSDMFEFIGALLRKRDAEKARQLLRECDVDPPTVELWIDENLPAHCASRSDLAAASDALSRADVHLGRVSKRMYYGLWKYASDMMVDGIVESLKTPLSGFARVNFPGYLSKMSRSRATRQTRKDLADKLSVITHTSANRVLNESIDYFRNMCVNDVGFRVALIREADLEADELAFLMRCKIDDKRIKSSMDLAHPPEPKEKKTSSRAKKAVEPPPAEKPKEAPAPAPAPPAEAAEPKPEPKPVDRRQKSLFDF